RPAFDLSADGQRDGHQAGEHALGPGVPGGHRRGSDAKAEILLEVVGFRIQQRRSRIEGEVDGEHAVVRLELFDVDRRRGLVGAHSRGYVLQTPDGIALGVQRDRGDVCREEEHDETYDAESDAARSHTSSRTDAGLTTWPKCFPRAM